MYMTIFPNRLFAMNRTPYFQLSKVPRTLLTHKKNIRCLQCSPLLLLKFHQPSFLLDYYLQSPICCALLRPHGTSLNTTPKTPLINSSPHLYLPLSLPPPEPPPPAPCPQTSDAWPDGGGMGGEGRVRRNSITTTRPDTLCSFNPYPSITTSSAPNTWPDLCNPNTPLTPS